MGFPFESNDSMSSALGPPVPATRFHAHSIQPSSSWLIADRSLLTAPLGDIESCTPSSGLPVFNSFANATSSVLSTNASSPICVDCSQVTMRHWRSRWLALATTGSTSTITFPKPSRRPGETSIRVSTSSSGFVPICTVFSEIRRPGIAGR